MTVHVQRTYTKTSPNEMYGYHDVIYNMSVQWNVQSKKINVHIVCKNTVCDVNRTADVPSCVYRVPYLKMNASEY